MVNQVRETKAGRAISACIVLDKKGAHVATINAHYSDGGRVTLDVWNIGQAVTRSFETARKIGRVSDKALAAMAEKAPDYYKEQTEREDWAARDMFGLSARCPPRLCSSRTKNSQLPDLLHGISL